MRVKDVATGEDLDDVLTKVKFSAATWLPDRSFLYVHFPTEGEARGTDAAALPAPQLRRHVLGTPQAQDTLVWELPENPQVIPEPELSHDGRWLVVHLHEGTSEKNRLWVHPVRTEDGTSRSATASGSSTRTGRCTGFVRSTATPCSCTPTSTHRWAASSASIDRRGLRRRPGRRARVRLRARVRRRRRGRAADGAPRRRPAPRHPQVPRRR